MCIRDRLWQVLYPEQPGSKPPDFTERHLIVGSDCVGVWGDRGIAVAEKCFFGAGADSSANRQTLALRDDFAAIVSLARDIDRLTADGEFLGRASGTSKLADQPSAENDDAGALQAIGTRGEELTRHAAQVQHTLTLPDRDLLRRFSDGIGVDQFLATLRDLNHTASEHLRRLKLAEQSKLMEERDAVIAKLRSSFEWLEVFIVGFLAIEIIEAIARHANLGNTLEDILLLLGGPVAAGLTAWMVKPWKRKPDAPGESTQGPAWILIAVIAACVAAWLAGLLHILAK